MEHDWRDWNRKFVVLKLCYKTTKKKWIHSMRPNLLRMLIFLMSWSLLFVLLSCSFGSHINSIAWFSIYPCLHTDLSYWWIWNDSWENKTIIKWQMESKNSQTFWCEMKIIFEIALRDDCCIISFAFHIPFAISSIETS